MKRLMRITMIVMILVIAGFILRNILSFDMFSYESTDDFIWYPSLEPEVTYELSSEVNSEEEAFQLFSEYIKDNYSCLERIFSNDIHVVYDEINEGYHLYYVGFAFLVHDTYGYIYNGTSELFIVIPI